MSPLHCPPQPPHSPHSPQLRHLTCRMGKVVTARAELLGLQGTRLATPAPRKLLQASRCDTWAMRIAQQGRQALHGCCPPKPPSLCFISLDRDWKRDRVAWRWREGAGWSEEEQKRRGYGEGRGVSVLGMFKWSDQAMSALCLFIRFYYFLKGGIGRGAEGKSMLQTLTKGHS